MKTAEFIERPHRHHQRRAGHYGERARCLQATLRPDEFDERRQMALQESSRYEQQRTENATQINLVQYLRNYIDDPANMDEVIPANVGLRDQNLTSVIDQYNTMIIERKRLLRTSSDSNPAIINMNAGIEAMRRNVRTTVNSVLKGLQIAKADIDRQASKFESRISDAPRQEKEFMTISASRRSRPRCTSCCCRSVRRTPSRWQPRQTTAASSRSRSPMSVLSPRRGWFSCLRR